MLLFIFVGIGIHAAHSRKLAETELKQIKEEQRANEQAQWKKENYVMPSVKTFCDPTLDTDFCLYGMELEQVVKMLVEAVNFKRKRRCCKQLKRSAIQAQAHRTLTVWDKMTGITLSQAERVSGERGRFAPGPPTLHLSQDQESALAAILDNPLQNFFITGSAGTQTAIKSPRNPKVPHNCKHRHRSSRNRWRNITLISRHRTRQRFNLRLHKRRKQIFTQTLHHTQPHHTQPHHRRSLNAIRRVPRQNRHDHEMHVFQA